MKKLLLMAALIAGPVLFAQEKSSSATQLSKAKSLNTERSDVSQKKQLKAEKSSDAKVVAKKSNAEKVKTKATVNRKSVHAKSLNETIEN